MEDEKNKKQDEGLKAIVSRAPFTPSQPIMRKEFFVGILIIAVTAFVINAILSVVLGGMNFFVSIVFGLIFSYVMSTWYTKRFLDIKPTTNAKYFQIIFFVLIFVLNILTYVQADMMTEFKAFSDYIVMNGLDSISGAPEVSATTEMYAVPVSIARAVVGIPLLLFVLFLLFKKSNKKIN
jgi:magnesium-transporting ATPase (P-type)